MTKEEEEKLKLIKKENLAKIKNLQPRILRVGSYLGNLQWRLTDAMDAYHEADRELANWDKLTVYNKKNSKQESIEDILKDPAKCKELFQKLKEMTNNRVIESLDAGC